jgi:CHAT domain-containing protein
LAALPWAALDEERTLVVAPSARVAQRGLVRGTPRPRRVLALGESSRLPQAGREATFIAARFEDGLSLVGGEATLAALQAHCAAADVVHLACHAGFRADNPRFSALHLADGPLTVDAAEALDLRGATVVLSACETGLADHGDEMVGLVRAFLVAGASRVVASLWPVDDAVAADTMAAFYDALRRGVGTGAALQSARRTMKMRLSHPHFWGAFALYGGF